METGKKRLKWSLPHSYTLIFFIMILMAALTWIVPSGQFERQEVTVDGVTKSAIVPGTYHEVSKHGEGTDLRQGIPQILSAPMEGIINAVDVVAFVLVVGGAFGIILQTGAIDRGLLALARRLKSKGILVIPIAMVICSLGGSTFGMSEEIIPLYAIFISLMFALGFDSMTAILILFLGTQIGYVGSTTNPFSVLIAQGIAGVQGNPQLWLRFIEWIVFTGISIAFTMWYAHRVKKHPEKSVVFKNDLINRPLFLKEDTGEEIDFSLRDKLIISGFVVTLGLIVWGILTKGWYMTEIGALFFALGLFAGLVSRMNQREMAENFVKGCGEFVYAAVIIGLARGILVLAENGMIIDTILNYLSDLLKGLPNYAFTTIMLLVHNIITFFVPSSSGEAALTMPVLAPLGDLVGINREAIVTTYQFGNGLTNLISPTGGVLLAGLAIARINFGQWLKVIMKLFVVLWIIAAVFSAVSAIVGM
ncbi:YfcC family protein [Paenibacillus sp. alder61]|uniref:Putative basic amino acid antiporter YfcC n=1 Tax=Paenibacillus faecis TaxID=862114 RepID=A0A5D0CZ93_9BACL|nr:MULTISPECIES: YfcC family protein [Paenibacillus]MCA1293792.1 YfcC family protein [Paenibacillus sp. alder61]TYA15379.1 putative basic amino acid antiporter YfcC [Paenibacillus faecis]